jgi:hypothetical protein
LSNITIHDYAVAKGAQPTEPGGESYSGGEYERLGLPFFSGCQGCGASLAPYNAFPSTTGFIRCRDCVEGFGYDTVEAFDTALKEEAAIEEEDDEPDFDPENIYGSPSIRQSIEEDRK